MSSNTTIETIKEVRDKTGLSVMQCKRAIEEAGGDIEKALIILSKQSSQAAEKKADREANEGLVLVSQKDGKAVLLPIYCETDFVAKNEDFVNLANTLVEIALSSGVDALTEKAPDLINPVIQKLGENIHLGKVKTFSEGTIGSYVHNGKNACVVALNGGDETLARDIAMHTTAMKPNFLKKEDINDDDRKKVIEVFENEIKDSDKPAEIKEKMLQGKIDTYFKEQTLLEQPFIKDPSKTIATLLKEKNAEIISFERFSF